MFYSRYMQSILLAGLMAFSIPAQASFFSACVRVACAPFRIIKSTVMYAVPKNKWFWYATATAAGALGMRVFLNHRNEQRLRLRAQEEQRILNEWEARCRILGEIHGRYQTESFRRDGQLHTPERQNLRAVKEALENIFILTHPSLQFMTREQWRENLERIFTGVTQGEMPDLALLEQAPQDREQIRVQQEQQKDAIINVLREGRKATQAGECSICAEAATPERALRELHQNHDGPLICIECEATLCMQYNGDFAAVPCPICRATNWLNN